MAPDLRVRLGDPGGDAGQGNCLPFGACRWCSGWAQQKLWALHMCGASLVGAGNSWGPTKPITHLCDQASQALEAVQLALVTGA